MSDAQHGYKITSRVVKESILKYGFNKEKKEYPSFILFAGDLVQNGSRYDDWQKQWFKPLSPLLPHIPVYPAIGNHEENHRYYFTYFDLPKNGSQKGEEHWYYFDYGNVRYISLDTNKGYRINEQIIWLRRILDKSEKDINIDFIIAFFHHPHQSEAWTSGELKYSGKIQRLLERFSYKTKKPSFHLCGHTHAYSRGHSFFSRHTMISVASLGGSTDDWREYPQKDYLEYIKTFPQFGWLKILVQSGSNPSILFKRYGFGNDKKQVDQGVSDEFSIFLHSNGANKPKIISLLENKEMSGDTVYLQVTTNICGENTTKNLQGVGGKPINL